jgi:hypothetical protein
MSGGIPPSDRVWAGLPRFGASPYGARVLIPLGPRTGLLAAVVAGVLLVPASAFAHTELEPGEAGPGTVIDLTLRLANEQPSPTTNVQLLFPEGQPLTVVAAPAVGTWTATVDGGTAGGAPATGITWSRSPDTPIDDPSLPFTVGPLPTSEGPLQFKVLQTYANGVVDRWIEETTPGGPEPAMPGPVLELVAGGPGIVPPTTATSAAVTTTLPPTTTTTTGDATDDDGEGEEGDDSNTVPIAIAVAAGVLVLGGGGYYLWRRSRRR